jgi:23S rRNA (adenine2030-N6)-methyltransferase
VVEAVGAVAGRAPAAVVCVWAPLKDLETFDGFVRALEALGLESLLVAEARLRPLSDPMRLNGCALVLLNAPPELEPELAAIVGWTAERLGEGGGAGRVWRP